MSGFLLIVIPNLLEAGKLDPESNASIVVYKKKLK
jgi:hypothetical protein